MLRRNPFAILDDQPREDYRIRWLFVLRSVLLAKSALLLLSVLDLNGGPSLDAGGRRPQQEPLRADAQ